MVDILSPIQIGPYQLPNRLIMSPMTRCRAGNGNVPGAMNATYYEQRASAGLIVTEATQISPQGVGYPNTPGIHSAEQVEGWKLVTNAVHAAGGHIFLQLLACRTHLPSVTSAGRRAAGGAFGGSARGTSSDS